MSRFHLTYGSKKSRLSIISVSYGNVPSQVVLSTTVCAFFSAAESSLWRVTLKRVLCLPYKGAAFALCFYYKPAAISCQRFFKAKYHICLTFAKRAIAVIRFLSLKLASRVTSFAPLPTTQFIRLSLLSP